MNGPATRSGRPGGVLGVIACLAMLIFASDRAQAGLTITGDTGASESNLGNFNASFQYTASSSTSATIVVDLTNTSPAANGGFLTSFGFNNPMNLINGVTLASTSPTFSTLLGGPNFNNGVNASPFGNLDIAVTTSGNFNGGGQPQNGIGVGETETFTFSLIGTGLDSLDEMSFVNTLSNNPASGKPAVFFLGRFRGFVNGGSDKVPGAVVTPPVAAVPEPSTLAMAVLGTLCISGVAIRRRRRAIG